MQPLFILTNHFENYVYSSFCVGIQIRPIFLPTTQSYPGLRVGLDGSVSQGNEALPVITLTKT
jgi:hypothetical protein